MLDRPEKPIPDWAQESLRNISGIQEAGLSCFVPPERLSTIDFIEKHVWLPPTSPFPGPMKLYNFQRGIVEAFDDPQVKRISFIKCAQIGGTKLCTAIIGALAARNPPTNSLYYVPTGSSAWNFAKTEIEPLFRDSPALRPHLLTGSGRHVEIENTSTVTAKNFRNGGSLNILSANTPNSFRARNARIVFLDEVDSFDSDCGEGDPIMLASGRTVTHSDRKIIILSTPLETGTSLIEASYLISDRREFHVPCPWCGEGFQILWENIAWPPGRPQDAYAICPSCEESIPHDHKSWMIQHGSWVITRPEIVDHAGFKVNGLISSFENNSWGAIAEKYLEVKDNPSQYQAWRNIVMGLTSSRALDATEPGFLQQKVEDISLDRMSSEVCYLTAFVDCQKDRLEIAVMGFSEREKYVLDHRVFWGSPVDSPGPWPELDEFLKQKFWNPRLGWIGIAACGVDSGGTSIGGVETMTQAAYRFCDPRGYRRIFATKGCSGPGPAFKQASKKLRNKLALIHVDQMKSEILDRLGSPGFLDKDGNPCLTDEGCGRNPVSLHLSDRLTNDFLAQCCAERRVTRVVKGRQKTEFQLTSPHARNEGLDLLAGCLAMSFSFNINVKALAQRTEPYKPPPRRMTKSGEIVSGVAPVKKPIVTEKIPGGDPRLAKPETALDRLLRERGIDKSTVEEWERWKKLQGA